MSDPDEAELQRLYFAWRQNKQPSFADEFNATIRIFDPNGKALGTRARITWNPLPEYYEMEPVTEVSQDVYQPVELVLEPDGFEALKHVLGEIGIHHFIRVFKVGDSRKTALPDLPESFFFPNHNL